jgi:hypothetical protein
MQTFVTLSVIVLFCSFLIWLLLSYRVFKVLEMRFPKKYESMGRPSLFSFNPLTSNLTFVKFLFNQEWRYCKDKELKWLSQILLIIMVLFLAGFLTVFLAFGMRNNH